MQPEILDSFVPIFLHEMEEVALMNRSDTKYIFHISRLEVILQQLCGDYRMLEVEGCRMSRYESTYFDYPDFFLYHQHRRGQLPRCKVRVRTYLENARSFLEVKEKNNKGKTLKKRLETGEGNRLATESMGFLSGFSLPAPENLMPRVTICYQRMTLVNIETKERITIDTGLTFAGGDNAVIKLPELVIAEVKQDKSKRSFFSGIMQQMQIREGGVSKYCMAVASIHKEIPHHNLKPKLRAIRKITHGTFADIA